MLVVGVHTGKCIRRFGGIYVKDYIIRSFLSIKYVHGDL